MDLPLEVPAEMQGSMMRLAKRCVEAVTEAREIVKMIDLLLNTGSRAITIKQAIVIAAIFEFLGASVAGESVTSTIRSGGEISQKASVPVWILVFGGVGIVFGLATLGYRVMRTVGTQITTLTPTRGHCAMLAAASTVVLASKTGLPVSTTHITVGAVMGMSGGLPRNSGYNPGNDGNWRYRRPRRRIG
jgi:hypothetical protein